MEEGNVLQKEEEGNGKINLHPFTATLSCSYKRPLTLINFTPCEVLYT